MTKPTFLLSAVLLAACTGGDADTIESFDTDASVTSLSIENGSGDVDIAVGASDLAHVTVSIWGERTSVTGDLDDSGRLTLRTVCANDLRCRVDYRLEVPASIAATVDNGSGDVWVNGLLGDLNLFTGSGDIEIEDAGAADSRVVLDTGSGDLELRAIGGASLELLTGSGDVDAHQLTVPLVRAQTGSGSVRLEWDEQPFIIEAGTGSGDCEVAVPTGAYNVDIDTGSGGVAIDRVTVDPTAERSIRISTGSGSVSIDGT
jgi:DUF4097 and DUF4098 domain-containing protein YvlB